MLTKYKESTAFNIKEATIQKYIPVVAQIKAATDRRSGATYQELVRIRDKGGISNLSFQYILNHHLDKRKVGKRNVFIWMSFNRNLTFREIALRSIVAQHVAAQKHRENKKQDIKLLEPPKQPVTVPMVVSQPVSLPSYGEMIESLRGRVAEKKAEQQKEYEAFAHYEQLLRQTRGRIESAEQEVVRLEEIIGKLEEIASIQGERKEAA